MNIQHTYRNIPYTQASHVTREKNQLGPRKITIATLLATHTVVTRHYRRTPPDPATLSYPVSTQVSIGFNSHFTT